jgi:phosphatidylinositol glycan class W
MLRNLKSHVAKANLQYVLWVAAYNTSFLLGYIILGALYHGNSPLLDVSDPEDTNQEVPVLLNAINKNGLLFFLVVSTSSLPTILHNHQINYFQANVLTGLVNLSVQTMYSSDDVAMGCLTVYMAVLCGLAWVVRRRDRILKL